MAKRKCIEKQSWKPGNVLSPAPPVLVSCGGTQGWKPNLITIAWAGNVCSDPPMLSISVRPERYSHEIIRTTREFVVNVTSLKQARAVDWCGMISGRDEDKFAGAGLTPAPALKVRPPIVLECPLNIECRVQESLELGSHTMFVAEVVAVQVSCGPGGRQGAAPPGEMRPAGVRPRAVFRTGALHRTLRFLRPEAQPRGPSLSKGIGLQASPHRTEWPPPKA